MSDIDLTEAVEATHVFTSTSCARGGGLVENVAACTCGHSLDWQGREQAHRKHVLAELVQATREQVAREIERQRRAPGEFAQTRTGDIQFGVDCGMENAARIARGDHS